MVGTEVKSLPEATLVHCEDKKEGLCGLAGRACMQPPLTGTMHVPSLRLHPSHPHGHTAWSCACAHKVGAHRELAEGKHQGQVRSCARWPCSLGGIFTSLPHCLFHVCLSHLCLSLSASLYLSLSPCVGLFLGLSLSPPLLGPYQPMQVTGASGPAPPPCAAGGMHPAEFLGLISIWPPGP